MRNIANLFGASALLRAALCFGLTATALLPANTWAADEGQRIDTITQDVTVSNVTYHCTGVPACTSASSGACYFFSPKVTITCTATDGSGSTKTDDYCQTQTYSGGTPCP